MEKVKLGIIGLGKLGRKHAENIHFRIPQAELTAGCSLYDEELNALVKEIDPRYTTKGYMEIIENDRLDGTVVASSSQEHAAMICAVSSATVPASRRRICLSERLIIKWPSAA